MQDNRRFVAVVVVLGTFATVLYLATLDSSAPIASTRSGSTSRETADQSANVSSPNPSLQARPTGNQTAEPSMLRWVYFQRPYVPPAKYAYPHLSDFNIYPDAQMSRYNVVHARTLVDASRDIGKQLIQEPFLSDLREQWKKLGDPMCKFMCKYLDSTQYVPLNMRRIIADGLERQPGRRILDISAGYGYLSWLLWRLFGHVVDSSDVKTKDYFNKGEPVEDQKDYSNNAMPAFLGIPRREWFIKEFTPVPSWLTMYDVIVMWQTVFNFKWTSPAQYNYFLASLAPHLNIGGVIIFHSNNFPEQWKNTASPMGPKKLDWRFPYDFVQEIAVCVERSPDGRCDMAWPSRYLCRAEKSVTLALGMG
eukprot:TRINITY_DN23_c2_g1_i1.p1 TRINITY_DN23_c2_g1~~TRINITY_DN23_c2_g1_i1.p1  ORF type:complete len:364 (+),score=28.14 TRINITY_DN23_c2_g1_i1:106-1197(+)